MDLKTFAPEELQVVLGALRYVANANGRFTDAERALVEGVARVHQLEIAADALAPVSFEEVARVVTDPHRRKRVVQLAIVMALVEGTPSHETEISVRQLATALGLDEEGLAVLYEVTNGRAMLARLDMVRRVGRFIRSRPGFPGAARMALSVLGLGGNDRTISEPYHRLERCAAGTLGRAVYDHFTGNGFKFPGERGGIQMLFHDLGHVLAGYGTDPQGEIQQAAFQAGFARRDGFSFLLFGILQFHIGMRAAPLARSISARATTSSPTRIARSRRCAPSSASRPSRDWRRRAETTRSPPAAAMASRWVRASACSAGAKTPMTKVETGGVPAAAVEASAAAPGDASMGPRRIRRG